MSELAQRIEKAYETAKELNLDVVVPDEYTLQLDIDEPEENSKYFPNEIQMSCINIIEENFGIDKVDSAFSENNVFNGPEVYNIKKTTSKSGNTHIYIRLKNPISDIERIAFQAALGSDPKREILSMARLKRGEANPTLLFEVKKKENEGEVLRQTGYERV